MDPTHLLYALSTIAQVAAALAALIGFLGPWQLDRLREQIARLISHPKDDPTNTRLPQLQREQRRLIWTLQGFLFVTLMIMGCAIVGCLYLDQARNWGGTPRLLWIAGILLVGGPIVVIWMAARVPRSLHALPDLPRADLVPRGD
jgi:hypothetical protein